MADRPKKIGRGREDAQENHFGAEKIMGGFSSPPRSLYQFSFLIMVLTINYVFGRVVSPTIFALPRSLSLSLFLSLSFFKPINGNESSERRRKKERGRKAGQAGRKEEGASNHSLAKQTQLQQIQRGFGEKERGGGRERGERVFLSLSLSLSLTHACKTFFGFE